MLDAHNFNLDDTLKFGRDMKLGQRERHWGNATTTFPILSICDRNYLDFGQHYGQYIELTGGGLIKSTKERSWNGCKENVTTFTIHSTKERSCLNAITTDVHYMTRDLYAKYYHKPETSVVPFVSAYGNMTLRGEEQANYMGEHVPIEEVVGKRWSKIVLRLNNVFMNHECFGVTKFLHDFVVEDDEEIVPL